MSLWRKQTFVGVKEDVIDNSMPVEGAILQQSAFRGSFSIASICPQLQTSTAACCVLITFGLLDEETFQAL